MDASCVPPSLDTHYTHVGALFISWAPSDSDSPDEAEQLVRMRTQSGLLSRLLKRGYNIKVEEFDIPRDGSLHALSDKLWAVRVAHENPGHFLIIYYGGHGGSDQNRNAIWKCFNSADSPKVDWTSLQGIFLETESELDVLMIIDCCSAGSSVVVPASSPSTRNTVFVLAACASDAVTSMDGTASYTAKLIEVLHTEESMSLGRTVHYIHSAIYSLLCQSISRFSTKDEQLVPCVPYVLREGPRVLRIERQAAPTRRQIDALGTNITSDVRGNLLRRDHDADAITVSPVRGSHPSVSPDLEASVPAVDDRSGPFAVYSDRYRTSRTFHSKPKDDSCQPPNMQDSGEEQPVTTLRPSSSAHLSIFSPSRDAHEEQRFMSFVSYDAMYDRIDSVSPSFLGTSEWILQDNTFLQWLHADRNHLIWISGKAGSGKSTLTKMVAQRMDSLRDRRGTQSYCSYMHMFWGSGSVLQRSMSGFYRSLLFQLLLMRADLISQATDILKAGPGDVDSQQWKLALEHVLATLYADSADSFRFYIFIDALDECSDDHFALVQFLLGLKVKVWVTSRPYYVFESGFENHLKLRLDSHNQRDIETYVRSKLSGTGLDEESSNRLIQIIVENSNGMFIYAVLATRELLDAEKTGIPLEVLIDYLPPPRDLGQLYTNILLGLSAENQANAARTFAVISASHSKVIGVTGIEYEPVLTTWSLWFALETYKEPSLPLDTQELTATVTSSGWLQQIDQRVRKLLTIFTGSLLEVIRDESGVTGSGGLISYIHNSVRQFVEESEIVGLIRRDLGTKFNAHLILLGSAIIELKVLVREVSTQDIYSIPLWSLVEKALTYASHVASEHSKLLVLYLDELDRVMTSGMRKSSKLSPVSHWASLLPLSHHSHDQWRDDLLSIATEYAIVPYVSKKLSEHGALISRGRGRPLLDYAILPSSPWSQDYGQRRLEVVHVLLRSGATFDDRFEGQSVRDRVLHACRFARIGARPADSISDRTRFLLTIEDMLT